MHILNLYQWAALIMGKTVKLHFQVFAVKKKVKPNYSEPSVNSGEKSPTMRLTLLCCVPRVEREQGQDSGPRPKPLTDYTVWLKLPKRKFLGNISYRNAENRTSV